MNPTTTSVPKPRRWDTPFDAEMTDAQVDQLLQSAPFCEMDPAAFPNSTPLRGILKNDCRISVFQEGDIVIREGEYGGSAFLILEGSLIVSLISLPPEWLGKKEVPKKGFWATLKQLMKNSRVPEARSVADLFQPGPTGTRLAADQTRIFIQDIPGTLNLNDCLTMTRGQLFGELAALNRSPRSATVIASGRAVLLEMRWQGFRDLMRFDTSLKRHVDQLYRKHSLRGHLRNVPILSRLSDESLQQLADATTFETHGEFQWQRKFKKLNRLDVAQRIQAEPVIVQQGSTARDWILMRNGFARLSRRYGDGLRTVAYAGKGHSFGLREIAHNWKHSAQRGYIMDLRAVGYVDVLRIPAEAVGDLVLAELDDDQWPAPLEPLAAREVTGAAFPERDRRRCPRDEEVDTGLLEFIVEHRFTNGTQAMLIDLDRCTRCDDCVRACAATHGNNPRFLRSGPRYENWMIASACMHCIDPVCMIGCPTGAIGRDEDSGQVVINDQTCIGCGTCANSCPYDNIRMVDIRQHDGTPIVDETVGKPIQKATKCDFCLEQSGKPACQAACPHDALERVDLTTPSRLYQLTAP